MIFTAHNFTTASNDDRWQAYKKMRLLKILFILLFLSSCTSLKKKETVKDFVLFGYSGYCFKDSINRIYPSNEIWYNDSVKLELDTTRLDIRQYFEFKEDSFINVAIRRPRKITEYFSIGQSDTIGLNELVNKTLVNKKYKNKYIDTSHSSMYCGWYYTLFYRTSEQKEFIITYTPRHLPDSLRVLHDYITKIILKDNHIKASKFRLNNITTYEAKELYRNRICEPPPLPEKIKKVKFTKPITVDSI
jgi:hypothetical protein